MFKAFRPFLPLIAALAMFSSPSFGQSKSNERQFSFVASRILDEKKTVDATCAPGDISVTQPIQGVSSSLDALKDYVEPAEASKGQKVNAPAIAKKGKRFSLGEYLHFSARAWISTDAQTTGRVNPEDSLGLTIGKQQLEDVLRKSGVSGMHKLVLSFTFKSSVLPKIEEGPTRSDAFASVDAEAAKQKAQIYKDVDKMITDEVTDGVTKEANDTIVTQVTNGVYQGVTDYVTTLFNQGVTTDVTTGFDQTITSQATDSFNQNIVDRVTQGLQQDPNYTQMSPDMQAAVLKQQIQAAESDPQAIAELNKQILAAINDPATQAALAQEIEKAKNSPEAQAELSKRIQQGKDAKETKDEITQQIQKAKVEAAPDIAAAIDKYSKEEIAKAHQEIDTEVAAGVQHAKDTIAGRIKTNVKENLVNQLFLVVGGKLDDKKLIVVKAGKFIPNTGAIVNSDGKSDLEMLRSKNSATQNLNVPRSTGAVDMTYAQDLGKGVTARVDVMGFHNRFPKITNAGESGNNLAATDFAYLKDHQWKKLDSYVVRGAITSKIVDGYVSVGKYDGKPGYAAGGAVKVKGNTVDTSYVNAPGYANLTNDDAARGRSTAFSIVDSQRLLKGKLTPYVGLEKVGGAGFPAADISLMNNTATWTQKFAGVRYVPFDTTHGGQKSGFTMNVNYEYRSIVSNDINSSNKGSGSSATTGVNYSWGHKD